VFAYHNNHTLIVLTNNPYLSLHTEWGAMDQTGSCEALLEKWTMENIHYKVLAIPLNRPEIVRFLQPGSGNNRGQSILIVEQRPERAAETAWRDMLLAQRHPAVDDLMAIDDPHGHLVITTTDRLVPVEALEDPGFLTRNLGGWAPIYFGVIGLMNGQNVKDDPLLGHAEVLADYGNKIHSFGADPSQAQSRLESETGIGNINIFVHFLERLEHTRQASMKQSRTAFIEKLYIELAGGGHFERPGQLPVPRLLLLDALLDETVRLELERRHALANGDFQSAEMVKAWQKEKELETGLRLILKGEYVVGRARRSTVLIAPELDVVVKQPGPEPFHEIELGARIYEETEENWPVLTHDGALVTPRGRLRLIIEEDVLPKIARVFGQQIDFSTLMGLTIEEYIPGDTIQQRVLSQPDCMTPALYEEFVLHQQVCELLYIENGDWHSANFMIRPNTGQLVHVDWGAARPLRPEELNPKGRIARLNQMKNIAFSFHNQQLAGRVLFLHEELIGDDKRLAQIRRRAEALVRAVD
jgi:hypothetical protein